MALAALPTAAVHTRMSFSALLARSAASVQRRPSTRVTPAWNSSSSNCRRGSLELTSARAPGRPASATDYLEGLALLAPEGLGLIRALESQLFKVLRRHIGSDVLAGKAGGIEFLDLRIFVTAGG